MVYGHPGQVDDHGDAEPVTEHVVHIESRTFLTYIRAAKVARMPLFMVGNPVRSLFLLECGKASKSLPADKERRYGQYEISCNSRVAGFGTALSG